MDECGALLLLLRLLLAVVVVVSNIIFGQVHFPNHLHHTPEASALACLVSMGIYIYICIYVYVMHDISISQPFPGTGKG